jgi:hypothetical protein
MLSISGAGPSHLPVFSGSIVFGSFTLRASQCKTKAGCESGLYEYWINLLCRISSAWCNRASSSNDRKTIQSTKKQPEPATLPKYESFTSSKPAEQAPSDEHSSYSDYANAVGLYTCRLLELVLVDEPIPFLSTDLAQSKKSTIDLLDSRELVIAIVDLTRAYLWCVKSTGSLPKGNDYRSMVKSGLQFLSEMEDIIRAKRLKNEENFRYMKLPNELKIKLTVWSSNVFNFSSCKDLDGGGYGLYLKQCHNRLMHALNGNTEVTTKTTKVMKPVKPKGPKLEKKKKQAPGGDIRTIQKELGDMARDFKKKDGKIVTSKKSNANIGKKVRTFNKLEKLAMSWVNPELYLPAVIATDFTSTPVARARTVIEYTASWDLGQAVPSNSLLPSGYTFSAINRCAQCASMVYYQNTIAASWSYTGFVVGSNGAGIDMAPAATATITMQKGESQALRIPYMNALSAYIPHGPVVYSGTCGVANDLRMYFLNAGDTFSITVKNNQSVTSVTIRMDWQCWTNAGFVPESFTQTVTIGTLASNAFTFTSSGAGYYGVRMFYTDYTGATDPLQVPLVISSILMAGNGATIGHLALPGFATNVTSISDLLIVSGNIHYLNTAAELGVSGKIVQYQLKNSENILGYLGSNGFTRLSVIDEASKIDAKKGSWSFMAPESVTDITYQKQFKVDSGLLIDSYWPVESTFNTVLVFANINYSSTANGQDGTWIHSFGFNYSTNDPWRSKSKPHISSSERDDFLEVFTKIPQYYENGWHIRDLFASIKSAVSTAAQAAVDYGPGLISLAQKFAPLAAAV